MTSVTSKGWLGKQIRNKKIVIKNLKRYILRYEKELKDLEWEYKGLQKERKYGSIKKC